jgi:hypothetical protein
VPARIALTHGNVAGITAAFLVRHAVAARFFTASSHPTASANNQGQVERNDQRSLAQHGHFRFDQLKKTFV